MFVEVAIIALVVGVAHSQSYVQVVVPASGQVSFTSPNYPRGYSTASNIIYNITGTTDYPLLFDVEVFDLENGNDFVTFSENVPDVGQVIFGVIRHVIPDEKPAVAAYRFRSTTSAVQARFTTDSIAYGNHKGFKVNAMRERLDAKTSLLGDCVKGKVAFSETDYVNTDKLTAVLKVDRTLPCRMVLHQAHTWILEQLPEETRSRRSVAGAPVLVQCSGAAGLTVSVDVPDESEADELIFVTTGSVKCRTLFAEFLKQI